MEQTFQHLHQIYDLCKTCDQNPRDIVGPKIREFCKLAERAGFAWAWADMCCIDKTSSAELSEAINAMYHYYEASGVCYVYLEDVPEPRRFSIFSKPLFVEEGGENSFLRSQWHRRGWTLQELIAPDLVIFLSSSWETLGTKGDLAEDIQSATAIPLGLLRHSHKLADFSIAQRMSWAASRETTRLEDRAYSLLGIFGIYMSPLYGEGAHSFRRLQEEIMRNYQDTTLFAWGAQYNVFIPRDAVGLRVKPPTKGLPVFASSPDDFRDCGGISYVPGLDRDIGSEHPMSFTSTPHGLFARVPLAHIHGTTLMNLSWTGTTIRPLNTPPQPVQLFMQLVPSASNGNSERAIRHYFIAALDFLYSQHRLVNLVPSKVPLTWGMAEIYIETPPAAPQDSPGMNRFVNELQMYNRSLLTPFQFHFSNAERSLVGLVKQFASPETGAWNGALSLIVDQEYAGGYFGSKKSYATRITFGTCSREMSTSRPEVVHWARARSSFHWRRNSYRKDLYWDHDCSTDHIATWERRDLAYVKACKVSIIDSGMYLELEFTRNGCCPEIMVLQSVEGSYKLS